LLPSHSRCGEVATAKRLCLFYPQNIAEFWNVATRPTDRNGLGLSPEEASREVASVEESLTLLPDVPAIYAAWKRLVHDHKVQGVKVYDARLVAVMNIYTVESILSINVTDFKRYDLITALHPDSLLA